MSSAARPGLIAFGIWLDLASCGAPNHDSDRPSEAGASPSMNPASEAGPCFIQASNYDQSCSVDTDCIGTAGKFPVQSGNYCQPTCLCGGDSINKKAVAQYIQDVSTTPVGSGAMRLLCSCGLILPPPCCANGYCTTLCPSMPMGVQDAEAAQDAEVVPPGSIMCGLNTGPFDASMDARESWRWCTPPATCVPFNGGWACCDIPSSGGPTICSAPLVYDAGGD
jgi:hypothetical protein